jgi:hypothetical protein
MTTPTNFEERVKLLPPGTHVVPVQPGDKRCLLKEWQENATTDPEQIAAWNRENPNYNTGAVAYPDGICVLDVDNSAFIDMLPYPLPETFTVTSASKKQPHLYFLQTPLSRALGNKKAWLDEVDENGKRKGLFDFQQDRKYVVGPGSRLADGSTYELEKNIQIIPIPAWLCETIADISGGANKPARGTASQGELVAVSDNPIAIAKAALTHHYGGDPYAMLNDPAFNLYVGSGARHNFLTAMCGSLHDGKRGAPELRDILYRMRDKYFRAGKGDRKITDKEINDIVKAALEDWEPYTLKAPLSLAGALAQFNDEYCYVNENHAIVEVSNRMVMNAADFRGAHAANRFAMKNITQADGTTTATRVLIAKEWLAWPERRQVESMVYEPGKPEFFDSKLNRWRGWGCEPVMGNTQPWEQLLDSVFGGDNEFRRWFELWCAYPIQHPGAKLTQAVILWGAEQGTGKTTIGETLGRIYGPNFSVIREDQLHASFNNWAADKQFILADEITGNGDKRTHADKLKLMVTGSIIHVNKKFQPEYTLRDSINYLFTSNHCNSFYVEEADRRFFVWEVNCHKPGVVFFDGYYRWLEGDGPSALFHKLQHLDLSDFQPHQPPPETAAKKEMKELGYSELDRWVRQQIDYPSELSKKGGHIWDAARLLKEYECATTAVSGYPDRGANRVKQAGMSAALKRAGLAGRRVQFRGKFDLTCYAFGSGWNERATHEWALEYHNGHLAVR